MKTIIILASMLFCSAFVFAQSQSQKDSIKASKYEKLMNTVQQLPEMAIGKPDNPNDSSMYFYKNDVMQMTVIPMWQEKGTQMGDVLKVSKINDDPLTGTLPEGDKKLANGLNITMAKVKNTVDDKKQLILGQVKTHLAALYKQGGKQASPDEMTQQANSMLSGPETFTTDQGKQGQLYLVNDYQPLQSGFDVVLLMPGTKPGTSYFVQFNYYKYVYDNNLPDELSDLKVFQFPDDQSAYVDFTKKFLKTFQAP